MESLITTVISRQRLEVCAFYIKKRDGFKFGHFHSMPPQYFNSGVQDFECVRHVIVLHIMSREYKFIKGKDVS